MNNDDNLYDEIESRISEMEKEDYEFGKRFSSKDYIIAGIVIVVCIACIIMGAFI